MFLMEVLNMNKKTLGLFFILGLFSGTAQTADQPESMQRFLPRWFNRIINTARQEVPTENPLPSENEEHSAFECSICLEDINPNLDNNDPQVLTQPPYCKHNFHGSCIEQEKAAFRERTHGDDPECPICKNPLEIQTNNGNYNNYVLQQDQEQNRRLLEEQNIRLIEAQEENRRLLEELNNIQVQENNPNTHLRAKTTVCLVGAGAIAASYIPSAAKIVKETTTTTVTKACQIASNYPKEIAGIAIGGTALYALKRGGMTATGVKEFVKKHSIDAALLTTTLYTAKMVVAANNK